MSRVPRRSARPRGAARKPAAAAPASAERLQKVLAGAGLASRREAEAWIRAGRLTVNGVAATLGMRVTPADQVRLDGRLVRARRAAAAQPVFLCHRSPGEALAGAAAQPAASESAPAPRVGLMERLPRHAGRRFIAVSPLPRVDGGLELVTADGALALRLQRGVHALACEFGVRVRGELRSEQLAAIVRGELDSGARLQVTHCEPAGGEGSNRWYSLAVIGASGKEVRQLFERQGALVSRVLRTQLGPLKLERALARGQFRELTADELAALLAPGGAAAAGSAD
jgi:23S rRNA pseudouridine2605 synthase